MFRITCMNLTMFKGVENDLYHKISQLSTVVVNHPKQSVPGDNKYDTDGDDGDDNNNDDEKKTLVLYLGTQDLLRGQPAGLLSSSQSPSSPRLCS